MILGEHDFVLVVNDGALGGKPTAIYDLYRVQGGKIVEPWDTLEALAVDMYDAIQGQL